MIRAKNSYFYDSLDFIYNDIFILDYSRYAYSIRSLKKKYSYSIQDKITRDFWFWNYLKISSS